MTKSELIHFLRINVGIENSSVTDSVYLAMSDGDIELYLQIVITRDFPGVSIDLLPEDFIYPVILLAKKELYYSLASKEAPLVDLIADNNNQIKRSQRFDHYMKLIEGIDKEYNQYNNDAEAGTRNTLTSFDVLLSSSRYSNTRRNYEKGVVPVLSVNVDNVYPTSLDLSWRVSINRFSSYKVYISEDKIFDEYSIHNKISEDAKLLVTIKDVHQNMCHVEGLIPNTVYHILVCAYDRLNLMGCDEIIITTESGD